MRNLTYRLTTALLTFSVGFALASFFHARHVRRTEGLLTPKPLMGGAKVASAVPSGWRWIDVKGQVSFYLPPSMEQWPPNFPWLDRVFRLKAGYSGDLVYLSYAYGERASCEEVASSEGRELVQRSEVVIDGKPALLSYSRPKRSGDRRDEFSFGIHYNETTLCFPDGGHGKKLYLYAAGFKLGEARQIFNSIEFH